MKQYLKPRYIFGFIAVAWVFSSTLVFIAVDNLQGPLDFVIRSMKITGLVLVTPFLLGLTFYAGAWTVLVPLVGVLALGNYLHRTGFRYARILTKRPVDLIWPVVRAMFFRGRFPWIAQPPRS
ncbi:hypothetical protein [Microvirga sesbaniae]|uniref:hypothetical protein n=1 Tax=Microvirga sesbaniae TaxID=681392 RepID=UPI0021C9E9F5|nr:hypothetical protein [Microvirga sp. HBU67692]